MTDQERKAIQMALDALYSCELDYDWEERPYKTFDEDLVNDAVDAIRKAFAQPEQEPVAWSVPGFGFLFPDEYSAQRYLNNVESAAKPTPLYTAPPKRKWVGLTDEELRHAYGEVSGNEWCLGGISNAETFCDIIEAKLKEKNHD